MYYNFIAFKIVLLLLAHKDFGHFYGSSYVAGPNGGRTPVSIVLFFISYCLFVGFEQGP